VYYSSVLMLLRRLPPTSETHDAEQRGAEKISLAWRARAQQHLRQSLRGPTPIDLASGVSA